VMSKVPPMFADFHKSNKDFFDAKKFDLAKTFQITTKAANGLVLTSKTKIGCQGAVSSLKGKLKDKDRGTFEAEVNSKHLVDGAWESLEVAKGLKVKVKSKHDHVEKCGEVSQECNMSVEGLFTQDNLAASLQLNFVRPKDCGAGNGHGYCGPMNTEVNTSLAAGVEDMWVGGELKLAVNGSKARVTDYNGGFAFKQSDLTIGVRSLKKASCFQLFFNHQVKPKTEVAASFDLNVDSKNDVYSFSKGLNFGLKHELDANSSVKGNFNLLPGSESLVFNGLYTHKLHSNAQLSLSTGLQLTDLCAKQKVGLMLELGDL